MTSAPKQRLIGVDVARGLALIGMMAIHILPGYDENYAPTLSWTLFSGVSAGLFALLAGVSLTFTSGGRTPLTGRALTAAKWALAVRALIIMSIGLLLAVLNPPAAIILAYYGTMFLMAIPLLGRGPRFLALAALGFAVLGPIFMQSVRDHLPGLGDYDPTFGSLVTEPTATISTLLVDGTYPAIPWMAYICAGLALGRLDLRSHAVQVKVALWGVGLAVGSWLLSEALLGPFGGRTALLQATPWLNATGLSDIQIWGPDPTLPTTSWWWLAILSPYSATPLELFNTIGIAAATLGIMLILAGKSASAYMPLAAMGGMTLTLYSAHLVALSTGFLLDRPGVCLAVHTVAAALFAVIWRNVTAGKQGPLERVVSNGAGRARKRVLDNRAPADLPARPGEATETLTTAGLEERTASDQVPTTAGPDAQRGSR
ncbi:heparan-alpha-glucosaminide N-acetyltransferase domain-containing protein [Arthrobacter sp. B3I4]|uniref:heparan-alpha-glucosaminide N-acetyltransferase domain-containing protein n=1 Tax=Arthrobacter sp. B3I4 TaxID=3042267 RepID=UPI00277EF911|nr:heparan-alpha-glucosaminide N-acetyltransferase domain-containing protein [Arthrobacter sp. B3I4]MDQ0754957.1 putative membrane protein [Arthrobacter sp. B3I4]